MRRISGSETNTTCPYCGVGCGITVSAGDEETVSVNGDQHHPANRGNLCLKGRTLGETISLENRLLHPVVYGERSTWNSAITHVANKFQQTIDQHGSESIAFYVSGQLLTEDYYV